MRWHSLVFAVLYVSFAGCITESTWAGLKSAPAAWHSRIWQLVKNVFSGNKSNSISSENWDWRQAGVNKQRATKKHDAKAEHTRRQLLISATSPAQERAFADQFSTDEQRQWVQSELHAADTEREFFDKCLARTESLEATYGSESAEILIELDSHVNVEEINPHLPIVAVVIPDSFLVEVLEKVGDESSFHRDSDHLPGAHL